MIIYDNTTNTDGTNYFGFVSYDDTSTDYDPTIMDYVYEDLLEWRAYLKALWLDVLRIKIRVPVYLEVKPLYHRRMLIPFSGWLAKAGYLKKN